MTLANDRPGLYALERSSSTNLRKIKPQVSTYLNVGFSFSHVGPISRSRYVRIFIITSPLYSYWFHPLDELLFFSRCGSRYKYIARPYFDAVTQEWINLYYSSQRRGGMTRWRSLIMFLFIIVYFFLLTKHSFVAFSFLPHTTMTWDTFWRDDDDDKHHVAMTASTTCSMWFTTTLHHVS